MAESAVLLPVRLETRFDEPDGFKGARLRVLVVPDVCWYDRNQPPSQAEIDLLGEAVAAAGGPLVTGAPSTPAAAAAFDALAAKVGPGRALWLARTSPAAAGRDGAQGTRIRRLPERLELYAALGEGPDSPPPVFLGTTAMPTTEGLLVTPADVDGAWWPKWSSLEQAGLTFTVDLGEPPGPIAPADLTVLYVVGLGEADAADALRAHLDAGDLGVLHPGLATNTIAGTPTAGLAADPAAWRALGERDTYGEENLLARSLTGEASLGPLVGSSPDSLGDEAARVLIPALWPALRGHAVTEIWGTGARLVAGADSEWAAENLRPDGPLPLLRIGDQPYGVWPVTDWESWQPDEDGEPAEGGDPDMRVALRVRDAAAERARNGLGTVVGADSAKLWDLLAQTPTSDAYEVRPGLKFSTLRKFFLGSPEAAAADEWLHRVESVAAAGTHIADALVTVGGPLPLRMNVVLPELALAPSGAPMFQPSPDVPVPQARAVDPARAAPLGRRRVRVVRRDVPARGPERQLVGAHVEPLGRALAGEHPVAPRRGLGTGCAPARGAGGEPGVQRRRPARARRLRRHPGRRYRSRRSARTSASDWASEERDSCSRTSRAIPSASFPSSTASCAGCSTPPRTGSTRG